MVFVPVATVFVVFSYGSSLYIHCVFNVPFSMVTEFLSIQPSYTKVQLKDTIRPNFLGERDAACVRVYIFKCSSPTTNMQMNRCTSSGLALEYVLFFKNFIQFIVQCYRCMKVIIKVLYFYVLTRQRDSVSLC